MATSSSSHAAPLTTLQKYLSLQHQLGFYGAYHSKVGNILVHILLVPVLFLTFQSFAAILLPPPVALEHLTVDLGMLAGVVPLRFECGGGTFLALVYEAYYALLDLPFALMYLPVLIPMVLVSNGLAQNPTFIWPMIFVNVGSWIAQILSHKFIEGGSPALLDNLVGALVLAPFFTFIEVILKTTSYRPQLEREIRNASGVYIREMKKGRKARM